MILLSKDSIEVVSNLINLGFTKTEANQLIEKLWARHRTDFDVEIPFRQLL